jgi:hypothetical protein
MPVATAESAPVVAPVAEPPPPDVVAPAVEHVVEPPAPAVEAPTTHQVQLTSEPAGATITLVDNGVMTVVGETPLDVTIDRARTYDVVFTLTGYDTRIERLAAGADQLAVALEAPPPPKRRKRSRTRVASAEDGTNKGTNKGAAKGTLMVSSKPPTEIVVDGVATVLMTPQRALELTPGKHKITLFNLTHGIDETIEVSIEAKKTTKLIRDFTRKSRSKSSR